jgi:hypothetical protein
MHGSQLALGLTDSGAQLGQTPWRYASILEGSIKRRLATDQFLAHADRLCLHRIEELLDSTPLFATEAELVGKLQDVHGTGVTVQLRSQGQTHAPSRTKVGNLLVR